MGGYKTGVTKLFRNDGVVPAGHSLPTRKYSNVIFTSTSSATKQAITVLPILLFNPATWKEDKFNKG